MLQKPRSLQKMLGNWQEGEGPLYARLAAALRAALTNGDIAPGIVLPPERTLADTLKVSRTTVIRSFGILREEGWLESRQGSGHMIRHPQHNIPSPYVNQDVVKAMARNPMMRPLAPPPPGTVDFSVSRQASIGPLLCDIAAEQMAALHALPASSGYQPLGLMALRSTVSDYIQRVSGLRTQPDEILITSGSQQAIWLIGQLYAPYSERVVLENPTYPGAISAFRMIGANLATLPVEPTGFVLDGLETLLKTVRPRLVMVTPTCHAPTGIVMPFEQRRALVELIDQYQVATIEDQTMLDLHVGETRPTSLAEISSTAPLLTIGSLSKLFWPGLRIGWIRAPQPIIEHLSRLKAVVDMGISPVVQLMATGLMEHADEVRRLRHEEIRRSLDLLCEQMTRLLPDWTWVRPAGGLSFWARLPSGTATEFAQVALLHGVTIVAGSALTSDGGCDDHVRLQFVQDSESITLGVRRLAQAWESYAAHRKSRR
ncbi:PLP-dependent aminotransferase family protein [Ancylobacter sp. Lp-2]|uniref:aminotransferase-like domain-containing protein n=1 Tax=Ancylobacter sp. Lp-2 TaxID=2881339 RepID=UPI001E2D82FB|nr:PLP-dependent aminotransferase family protein [Ancylobacter sp. Lp-2]MCB4767038.1 PLP-dependent aminotransferase family protein [Ancylobacter sp. Lp-2]